MNSYTKVTAAMLLGLGLTAGCTMTPEVRMVDGHETQLETRSYQSRTVESADANETLRDVVATLQDLGFVIRSADSAIGIVSATRFDGRSLTMTVTVRSRGERQAIVRANAQFGLERVVDPEPYQEFFTSLEKSRFLTAETTAR